MNLTTIGHIPSRNLKRFKAGYITAVAGVALAISATLAFAPFGGSTRAVTSPQTAGIATAILQDQTTPRYYLYIVANEDERAALVAQLQREAQNPVYAARDPRSHHDVVIAGSLAARELLAAGTQEMSEHGVWFEIVDTLAKRSQRQASEADVAASVLSTELANFVAPAIAPKVADADIAASVLSTELANFGS